MRVLLVVLLVSVAGCAHNPYDAPWDPPQGRQLFEQIPNWDGEAFKTCTPGTAGCVY
jgi:hypothetical protein